MPGESSLPAEKTRDLLSLAEQEIRKLAAFPRCNPNPVLELSSDGVMTYANDAAWKMAKALGRKDPTALLPLNASTIIKMSLSSGQSRAHVNALVAGRTLSWSFFPLQAHQVVHCYAEDITDSLNLEAQVRQMQKMESVGQLAAGIAHDFNNVLTVIQGHASLLQADNTLDPVRLESAKQILQAAERAANLTRQLLAFSRKQIMQQQLLDLNDVVGNISKMLRTLLGERITLCRESDSPLPPVCADAGMLEQVLINLAVNARDAMPSGGTLTILTGAREVDEAYVKAHPEARLGSFALLSVGDTGQGMDPLALSHIFEPFFTTKEAGKGTGLGLATAYGIIKQHRGWMEVDSRPGQGTTFRIFLPASSKAPLKTEGRKHLETPGGHETILIVEDDDALRKLMHELLQKKGYAVFEAATGAEALAVWSEHGSHIDLVLADLMMPEGISGRELAARALAQKPHLKVLYTSGYNPETLHPNFHPKDGVNFLQKPYPPEMLAEAVRNCLDQ